MRKGLLLTAAMLVAACSDSARPASSEPSAASESSSLGAPQARALARLQSETGAAWRLVDHSRLGTPTLLEGRSLPLMVSGVSATTATKHFLADHRDLFGMADPDAELVPTREVKDELGMTHARFQQVVRGVRVVGGEILAHFTAAGELASVRAAYVPGLASLDLAPSIDASRAIAAAIEELRGERPEIVAGRVTPGSSAELVVFEDDAHAPTLAYRVHLRAGGDDLLRMEYTVDARTGVTLDRFDDLETVVGSGTGVLGDTKALQISATANNGFSLTDTTRTPNGITTYTAGTGTTTPGALVTSTTATTWDATGVGKGAAVDAHFYAGVVYDYFKTAHARKGIDGVDGAIVSTVHFQAKYDNAFWDGTQMVYGDGDGTAFRAFSASLDVIGHELTHGITQNTSQLVYSKQSGALNEAVSDIFGTFVEHAYKPDPKNNLILGEGISIAGRPIRDMAHPGLQNQPAAMSQLVTTTQDNGGVHTNSGIVNNAMFLMTLGGTNDASKIAVSAGIGWDRSAQLWYRAAFHYFVAATDFKGAADDRLLAATDLGFTANEKNIVECAWIATGVLPGTCKPLTAPASPDAGAPDAGGSTTPPTDPVPTPGGPTGSTGGSTDAGASSSGSSTGTGTGTGADAPSTGSPAPAPRQTTLPSSPAAATCAVGVPGAPSGSADVLALIAAVLAAAGFRKRGVFRR